MQNLREISAAIGEAVYHAAVDDGAATRTHEVVRQAVPDHMWQPGYD